MGRRFYRGGLTVLETRESAKQARRDAFGRALIQARLARDLSQEALAALLGVTQGSVSNWENGRNLPDDPTDVFDIERALEVPAGFLTQHLGYAPLGLRGDSPLDVEAVIASNPLLTKVQKTMLTGAYRDFVNSRSHPQRRVR